MAVSTLISRSELLEDDRQPVGVELSTLKEIRLRDMAVRFAFGAVIALIAAVVGIRFGPRVGGLFLAFPATLPAALTLIEKKEGLTKALADASGGILGSVGMAAYAAVALVLLPRIAAVLALVLALLAWALVSVGLFALLRVTGLDRLEDRSAPI
ncbi:MAG TPA: DUF3147 family protein [Candidatus Limnocylindrales bacterium]|nr:DUF3147 family protein [Candidatus Limnocylindrales bacterium]